MRYKLGILYIHICREFGDRRVNVAIYDIYIAMIFMMILRNITEQTFLIELTISCRNIKEEIVQFNTK